MTYLRPFVEKLIELTSMRLIKWRLSFRTDSLYCARVRGVGWVYFGRSFTLGVAAFPVFARMRTTTLSYDEYEALTGAVEAGEKEVERDAFERIMAPVMTLNLGDSEQLTGEPREE